MLDVPTNTDLQWAMVTLQILATLEILAFPQLEHSNVRSRKKK